MPLTIPQVVERLAQMNPRRAVTTAGIREELCTLFVDSLIIDGRTVPLSAQGGKHGAGYCRVSTEEQRSEGWSLDEQVARICTHFADLNQSFYLYNDGGISGFYPPRDPALIADMLEKHAQRYQRNFETVLLSGRGARKRTDVEREGLERYLRERVQQIKAGATSLVYGEANDETDDEIKVERRQRATYRPALTLLLERLSAFSQVAITDSSRLSRNYALTPELMARLERAQVRLVGLIESLDFIAPASAEGDARFFADLQLRFLAWAAEKQLNSMSIASLRGTVERLDRGEMHGKLPYFLEYDEDKRARWKPYAREALTELIRLVMTEGEDGQRRSYSNLRRTMTRLYPDGLGHREAWSRRRISDMLHNQILAGRHTQFGITGTMPDLAILTADEFDRLQVVLDGMADTGRGRKRTQTASGAEICYLATSLIRCVCGGTLYHVAGGKAYEGYACAAQIEARSDTKGVRHTKLNSENTEGFIGEFMSQFQHLASPFTAQDDAEVRELKGRLRAANDSLLDAQVALRQAEDRLRAELRQEAIQSRLEDGAAQDQFIALLMPTRTRELRVVVNDRTQERDRVNDRLSQLQARSTGAAIREKIARWGGLDTAEQNAILLTVFDRWETRGTDPQCAVVPILAGGMEMPPIPLVTVTRVSKATGERQFTRRFPSLNEYLEAVDAAMLDKTSGG